MGIISVSMNEKMQNEISRLKEELGFSGTSEVIRAGLRLLISEEKEKSRLSGRVEGVLIVINEERHNEEISRIRHDYGDIIKTQIHNHLSSHKCLQIFILNGSAEKIKALIRKFQTSKKAEYVKLFIS